MVEIAVNVYHNGVAKIVLNVEQNGQGIIAINVEMDTTSMGTLVEVHF